MYRYEIWLFGKKCSESKSEFRTEFDAIDAGVDEIDVLAKDSGIHWTAFDIELVNA